MPWGSILTSLCGFKHMYVSRSPECCVVSFLEERSVSIGGSIRKALCEPRGREIRTTWVSLEVMGMADGMD